MARKLLKCMLLTGLLAGTALLGGCGGADTPASGDSSASGEQNLSETGSSAAPEGNPKAVYVVSTDTSGLDASYQVSDTLYGVFLEDINFALDGGMYVELLKNRSFEYSTVAGNQNKHGWVLSDPDQVSFDFTVMDGTEDNSFLNSSNPHYAILSNSASGFYGIFNKGFLEGLTVQADAEYVFSGYFKAPFGYDNSVRISIKDGNGSLFAEGTISGLTRDWQKYTLTLIPNQSSSNTPETCLYVEIEEGCVYADMLSLMPADTYKGTYIRKDIGEYLEALNPSFLRFPGGCVIEGRDLESMYSWKDSIGNGAEFEIDGVLTVGDIAVRSQGKSIWNGSGTHPYYTTYGIGFYEFFELCEILDCMPVPILNAGMTCQVQSPKYIVFDIDSEEFATCIQDALDLVQFCLGGQDTYWGSVRIAMGHEETFALKYIGIGNEQWQNEYFQHYKKFVEAFEGAAVRNPELYGDIELIVANSTSSGDTVGWTFLNNNPDNRTGLVDEHYYESPNWFLTNTTRYDKYDRDTQAKVFLGEYAAQSNTLEAALAEAAYMTGLERNSDIVAMACYAPLFGNRTSNQWTPDLIWYSQSSVFGSVNYYVQKLYGGNVGVTLLPSALDTGDLQQDTVLSGKVGLGTWQTSAAFDNLAVTSNETGEVLYSCSFDDGNVLREDGWKINEGEWAIKDGRLVQSYTGAPFDTNTGDSIYIGDPEWSNYTLTVEAEILSGAEGFLIPICVENAANNIFWNIGGWGNTVSCLQIVSANVKSGQITGTVKNMTLKHNQVYNLKVEVNGNNIRCYMNDMLYVDYTYESSEALYETASVDENGDIILKLVNVYDGEVDIDITLEDIDMNRYENTAMVTVLSGENLSDVNSFEEPEKMVPVESSVEVSGNFTYTAPAYSVNIIRILNTQPKSQN